MELSIDIPELARLIAVEMRVTPAWLSPAQAATYTGIPEKTLEQYRRHGTGPALSRVGKHVRYARTDIDAWLKGESNAA